MSTLTEIWKDPEQFIFVAALFTLATLLVNSFISIKTFNQQRKAYDHQRAAHHEVQKMHYARRVWIDYLNLAFENPQLAFVKSTDFDKIKSDPEMFEQYEWFISILLEAVGELLQVDDILEKENIELRSKGEGHYRNWYQVLILQLSYHKQYFEEVFLEKDYSEIYPTAVTSAIRQACKKSHLPGAGTAV